MTSSMGGEFEGKSVEEAVEAGLAALGLKEKDVTIEVLSRGSRGLLGFGAEDARVRIVPKAPKAAPVAPAPKATPPKPTPKPAAPAARPTPKPAPPAAKPAPKAAVAARPGEDSPVTDEEMEAVAVELLEGMLERMDIDAAVVAVEYTGVMDAGQDPPLVLNIEGEDLGILIGRRGETLDAIQYLLRLMVNHRVRRWTNLIVDVEGYKARREESLRQLALRTAERVVATGRAVPLEAMPARERRIIHIALRDHPDVTTQSVGEDESRKVTVIPRK